MTSFRSLHFPEGEIAFVGTIRVCDEGVSEFRVDLPDRQSLYGEWKPIFIGKSSEFKAEVVSFGYSDMFGVGSSGKNARASFSQNEREIVEKLIIDLFSSVEARKGVSPFGVRDLKFTGDVEFAFDWLV